MSQVTSLTPEMIRSLHVHSCGGGKQKRGGAGGEDREQSDGDGEIKKINRWRRLRKQEIRRRYWGRGWHMERGGESERDRATGSGRRGLSVTSSRTNMWMLPSWSPAPLLPPQRLPKCFPAWGPAGGFVTYFSYPTVPQVILTPGPLAGISVRHLPAVVWNGLWPNKHMESYSWLELCQETRRDL